MDTLDRTTANAVRVLAQTFQEICLPRVLESACDEPLSRNQIMVLNLLGKRDRFPVSAIARLLAITPPAATKIVDRLEILGLAERRSRPGDRRVAEVALRDEGRTLLKRIGAGLGDRQARVLSRFSDEEKTRLHELVRKYVRITLAEEDDTEVICLQCFNRVGEDCVLEDRDTRCLRRLEA
ncbi:MAG: MarR family transcriptional regulator [bacterium]|nr:MarR family transcriptional regulator [bacterium]